MRDSMPESIEEIIAKTRRMFEQSEPSPEELEREQQRAERLRERAREQERARKTASLRASGLALSDDDARTIVAEAYAPTKALEHVMPWVKRIQARDPGASRMLIVCGGVGAGKTFAAGVALSLLGGSVVRASRLAAVVDPWRDELRSGEERLDMRKRFLVLDDLGAERDSRDPRWSEALFELVDTRMDAGMFTLITSNLRKKHFRDHYGERVIDRLNHAAKVVEIPGASMRQKAGGL